MKKLLNINYDPMKDGIDDMYIYQPTGWDNFCNSIAGLVNKVSDYKIFSGELFGSRWSFLWTMMHILWASIVYMACPTDVRYGVWAGQLAIWYFLWIMAENTP